MPDGCVFRVADNGQGHPRIELLRFTDAFYCVDKSRSRSGAPLGLSSAMKLSRSITGTMSFESVSAKGLRTVVLKESVQ